MFPALHAKKVLLGISGSIAAYKTPILVRALIKAGAEVQVVMTLLQSRLLHHYHYLQFPTSLFIQNLLKAKMICGTIM